MACYRTLHSQLGSKIGNKLDWFENLTGFQETNYEETRSQLEVKGDRLFSRFKDASYGVGELELASLKTLRERASSASYPKGRMRTSVLTGDVGHMHRNPNNSGGLFQVASQFNLLEMVSPDVTPEHGVTRYQYDHTQGPVCAIAAGAATIYRNYFASIDNQQGQTTDRQFDGLADLGIALSSALKCHVDDLWTMQNGYALCSNSGLQVITKHLKTQTRNQIDNLRSNLQIGLHWDVEVTEASGLDRPFVSQSFCSALPVAYSQVPHAVWETFALLVLEAAYEATMWAAVLNAQRGASNVVFLTLLGGGAFGNHDSWILSALHRALNIVKSFDLDVRIVSYGTPTKDILAIVEKFQ